MPAPLSALALVLFLVGSVAATVSHTHTHVAEQPAQQGNVNQAGVGTLAVVAVVAAAALTAPASRATSEWRGGHADSSHSQHFLQQGTPYSAADGSHAARAGTRIAAWCATNPQLSPGVSDFLFNSHPLKLKVHKRVLLRWGTPSPPLPPSLPVR
jgi:hypothetical protein